MDQNLLAYIADCRSKGFSDADIKVALLKSGWGEEQVSGALMPAASQTATPTSHMDVASLFNEESLTSSKGVRATPKKGLIIGGVIAAVLVILSGSSIALAEKGYLPAVSRVYRQTPLPFIWKGTNASASLSLGKMLLATSGETVASMSTTLKSTIDKVDSSKEVKIGDSSWVSNLAILNTSPKTYADVIPNCKTSAFCLASEGQDQSFNLDSAMPVSVSMATTLSTAQNNDFKGSLTVDLTDLASKYPDPSREATTDSKITIEGSGHMDVKKGYFKTNLIPYSDESERGKWFSYDLPQSFIDGLKDPHGEAQQIDKSDLDTLASVLDANSEDKGIIRQNGKAVAVYHVRLDRAALKKLSGMKPFADYQSSYESQTANDPFIIDMDFAIDPQSAVLQTLDITASLPDNESNIKVTFTSHIDLSYDQVAAISTPATDQIITKDAGEYGINAYSKEFSNLRNGTGTIDPTWFGNSRLGINLYDTVAGMFSDALSSPIARDNTTRHTDLVEIAHALEIYHDENKFSGSEVYPSTAGVKQSLNNASVLATNIAFTNILRNLPSDPAGGTYSYTSNGSTYTLEAIILDEDTGLPTERFSIKDGFSSQGPITDSPTL